METDDPVAYFVGQAHAASTQKAYGSVVRRFDERWRAEEDVPTITTARARTWLAEVAAAGASAATVQTYRSALSTEHVKRAKMGPVPDSAQNPLHCDSIDMLLAGIKKKQALMAPRLTLVQAERAEQGNVIDASMIEHLRLAWAGTTEECEMYLAAASLATAMLFRPSEMLGSQVNPDRALKMGQVAFHDDQVPRVEVPITKMSGAARDIDASTLATPTSATITLYETKTNQSSKPTFTTTRDPTAVSALWVWMNRRRRYTSDGLVFADHWGRLTTKKLVLNINLVLKRLDALRSTVSARAFRRGGASDLSAAGTPAAVINHQGRWAPSSAMALDVYSSTAARRRRSAALPGART